MLNDHTLRILQERYDLGPIRHVERLAGGQWKALYRIDVAGARLIANISHRLATPESVAYEHAFLRYLHARLPEAPTPLVSSAGASWLIVDDRIISLFPWMRGVQADRVAARKPAAQLLARFHRASSAYPDRSPRPGSPPLREWDWSRNRLWDWPAIEALLEAPPGSPPGDGPVGRFWRDGGPWAAQIADRLSQIAAERTAQAAWVADLAASGRELAFAPIHGGFYRRNLLVEAGRVTALLDWDDCRPDWLALDLSNAAWEFCRLPERHSLDWAAARAFVAAYFAEAGDPHGGAGLVAPAEHDVLLPLICCRRISEVLAALQGVIAGEDWNPDHAEYVLGNLLALEHLRDAARPLG